MVHRLTYHGFSEDLSPFSHQGSFLFSQPAEVDHWSQAIPYQDGFPLTPPDSSSECSVLDCPDMNTPTWDQASLPEESWTTVPAPAHSTVMQPSSGDWQPRGASVTAQDLQAMDASSWLDAPNGAVGMGLSPALSQESQSTRIHTSFPEPGLSPLPPGLDLSFVAESAWSATGPVVYPSPNGPQDYGHYAVQPQAVTNGFAADNCYAGAAQLHQSMLPSPNGHAPCSRISEVQPSTVQRSILPRTEVPIPTQYHALQLHSSDANVRADRVSNGRHPPQESMPHQVRPLCRQDLADHGHSPVANGAPLALSTQRSGASDQVGWNGQDGSGEQYNRPLPVAVRLETSDADVP